MRKPGFGRLLMASVLMLPLLSAGCAEHRTVVAYGTWGPGETVYYTQWEHETHRDHVEYEQRKADEQHQYWEWRKHHHD